MGRRRILSVDTLEGRELMSVTPILGLIENPPIRALAGTGGGGGGGASGSASASGTTGFGSVYAYDPTTGQVQNQNIGGSGITTDLSPATASEIRRRLFTAKFSGRVLEQPPRLQDQARQFFILAPGNTNQFLHGTLQMRYYTPNSTPIPIIDPNTGLVAVAGPGSTDPLPGTPLVETQFATTGTLSISDRSTQSGGVILANLIGSVSNVDRLGRPTQFMLSLNGGGGSGGIYASSVGNGTVNIVYHGNRAVVTVNASIFQNGVGNPLNIFQTNTHH